MYDCRQRRLDEWRKYAFRGKNWNFFILFLFSCSLRGYESSLCVSFSCVESPCTLPLFLSLRVLLLFSLILFFLISGLVNGARDWGESPNLSLSITPRASLPCGNSVWFPIWSVCVCLWPSVCLYYVTLGIFICYGFPSLHGAGFVVSQTVRQPLEKPTAPVVL